VVLPVALDAMGGDHAPAETVAGALAATERGVDTVLVDAGANAGVVVDGFTGNDFLKTVEALAARGEVEHARALGAGP
jgi:fatty acid/phospholipid biosynthesis enzyme